MSDLQTRAKEAQDIFANAQTILATRAKIDQMRYNLYAELLATPPEQLSLERRKELAVNLEKATRTETIADIIIEKEAASVHGFARAVIKDIGVLRKRLPIRPSTPEDQRTEYLIHVLEMVCTRIDTALDIYCVSIASIKVRLADEQKLLAVLRDASNTDYHDLVRALDTDLRAEREDTSELDTLLKELPSITELIDNLGVGRNAFHTTKFLNTTITSSALAAAGLGSFSATSIELNSPDFGMGLAALLTLASSASMWLIRHIEYRRRMALYSEQKDLLKI